MNKWTVLFLLVCCHAIQAQDFSQYEKKEFASDGGRLPYRILYPLHYDPKKAYPLVVFLHGTAQRGTNNESQLVHGGAFFLIDSVRTAYPAIVIFPQCPRGKTWSDFQFRFDIPTKRVYFSFHNPEMATQPAGLVKKLVDSMLKSGGVNPSRLYIGGLSMGAFGTYDMLARYPGFFAAGFPICGAGDTTLAGRFAKMTSVWIFHGRSDPLVNVDYSRMYFHALQSLQGDVRYSEYPGVRHNSWENAFREKEFAAWLFSKKRK
jgi:predicted peptidase